VILRSVLASGRIGENVTRSDLEERFLAFLDRAALPRPEINAQVEIAGRLIECGCLWRPQRVIVELDGHAVHGRRDAFEADRARDRALQAARWRVVRVTWRQLHREAERVTADMRELLRSPSFPA
jgi:very-short-patch-repair endonuclease